MKIENENLLDLINGESNSKNLKRSAKFDNHNNKEFVEDWQSADKDDNRGECTGKNESIPWSF